MTPGVLSALLLGSNLAKSCHPGLVLCVGAVEGLPEASSISNTFLMSSYFVKTTVLLPEKVNNVAQLIQKYIHVLPQGSKVESKNIAILLF